MVDPCKGPLRSHECEDHDPDHDAPPSLYPPPPPSSSSAASHGRSTFLTALIVISSVLAFLAICLTILILVRRRRLRRHREAALLEATALAPATTFSDDDGGEGPGEEVVHHAWHIRTVGLDEAAIQSIALARYRAGDANASDCTVCLGDYRDGELLRLLPKCAHAFHVHCIDTWLRAHVTCPLCRATVIDPAAAEQPDPTPLGGGGAAAVAVQEERDAGNTGSPGHGQPGQHANEHHVQLQIDRPDRPGISSEQPRQRPCPRPRRSFRRVASMDSPPPPPVASAEETLPEHGQAGGEKQGTGGAVRCEASLGSDRLNRAGAAMKRSLSAGSRWALLSRPCRPRSSLLPL